jgi:hypothetical protein
MQDALEIEKLTLRSQRELVTKWLFAKDKAPADYDVSPDNFEDIHWWDRESNGTVYDGGSIGTSQPQMTAQLAPRPSI